jgi:hypothetical protein
VSRMSASGDDFLSPMAKDSHRDRAPLMSRLSGIIALQGNRQIPEGSPGSESRFSAGR